LQAGPQHYPLAQRRDDALLYALGTTYNLTKRTFIYGTVAYVDNSKNGNFSVFATPRDSSSPTSLNVGESQTGVYIGMMHVC
jgi:predicted porin